MKNVLKKRFKDLFILFKKIFFQVVNFNNLINKYLQIGVENFLILLIKPRMNFWVRG